MNIPDKDWNAEKGIMEDTFLPEWQEYYQKLKAHKEHYAAIKPVEPDPRFYSTLEAFKEAMDNHRIAFSKWSMNESCFEPNKPGYYRANND